jgi:hypothetical protein
LSQRRGGPTHPPTSDQAAAWRRIRDVHRAPWCAADAGSSAPRRLRSRFARYAARLFPAALSASTPASVRHRGRRLRITPRRSRAPFQDARALPLHLYRYRARWRPPLNVGTVALARLDIPVIAQAASPRLRTSGSWARLRPSRRVSAAPYDGRLDPPRRGAARCESRARAKRPAGRP